MSQKGKYIGGCRLWVPKTYVGRYGTVPYIILSREDACGWQIKFAYIIGDYCMHIFGRCVEVEATRWISSGIKDARHFRMYRFLQLPGRAYVPNM